MEVQSKSSLLILRRDISEKDVASCRSFDILLDVCRSVVCVCVYNATIDRNEKPREITSPLAPTNKWFFLYLQTARIGNNGCGKKANNQNTITTNQQPPNTYYNRTHKSSLRPRSPVCQRSLSPRVARWVPWWWACPSMELLGA